MIDIRADVNRNGTIDFSDATEDDTEATWSASAGAIFLPNIDDDAAQCPTNFNLDDTTLMACNDATDTVVNGSNDELDLARLKTAPWANAPSDASGQLAIAPTTAKVRLFKKSSSGWVLFTPATDKLPAAELRSGVEFGIEGTDIVRDNSVWDGIVDITFAVDAGTGPNGALPDGSDTVRMRVAPVVFPNHTWPADAIYAMDLHDSTQPDFIGTLTVAVTQAGIGHPLYAYDGYDFVFTDPETNQDTVDQWLQDYLETATVSMPAVGRQQTMNVNFRSANYTTTYGLRIGGRIVFTNFRGSDNAAVLQYDPNHPDGMDSLNSFGNFETIPPYTNGSKHWPLGRVIRGGREDSVLYYPDKSVDRLVNAQGLQNVFYVDTSWLLVGHVDETLMFQKAATTRGWILLAADPALGKTLLQNASSAGYGSTKLFIGKVWSDGTSMETTIDGVLSDTDVLTTSANAVAKIDTQVAATKAETGLTDVEIIHLPVLFETDMNFALAYTPDAVNSLSITPGTVAMADPHGPVVNGKDIFKQSVLDALTPYGIAVAWVEDWDGYHINEGEVHCGTNARRPIPSNIRWWENMP